MSKFTSFTGAHTSSSQANNANLKVRINPLVDLTILDSYQRKPQREKRAIGCLLGYLSESNQLEITDAFPVIHNDDSHKNISIDLQYYSRMLNLKLTGSVNGGALSDNNSGNNGDTTVNTVVNPNSQSASGKEVVVGWFSITGPNEKYTLNDGCVPIHKWFMDRNLGASGSGFKGLSLSNSSLVASTGNDSRKNNTQKNNLKNSEAANNVGVVGPQYNSPVYLQVEIKNGIEVKAFASDFIPGSEDNLLQFYELPLLKYQGEETQILQLLAGGQQDNFVKNGETCVDGETVQLDSLNSFKRQLHALKHAFTAAKSYTDSVISGQTQPNTMIGRQLLKELSSIHRSIENELGGSMSDTNRDSEDFVDENGNDVVMSGNGNERKSNDTLKDTLMVKYLSVLCKAQVSMVEKLSGSMNQQENN